LLRMRRPSL